MDGEIGTVAWFDGNPETTGTAIAEPTTANLNNITDLWAQVTLTDTNCVASTAITVTVNAVPTDVIGSGSNFCSGTNLNASFTNTLEANETIHLYEDASLTTAASPATATASSWTSTNTYTTATSIWAVIVNTNTSCQSSTAVELVFALNQTDTDGDGVTDCDEIANNTNPLDACDPVSYTHLTLPTILLV